jgi:hypothetical protein
MDFEKLFKALVIGGSVLASSCASTSNSVTTNENPNVTKPDCSEICTQESGGETFCPEDGNTGPTNCCWLMLPKHECCGS